MNPDCPACAEKRLHTAEDWKNHPLAGHGFYAGQGWSRRSVEFNRRETSMLVELVNSGETDKTIAFALGITTGTLKVYWTRMRLKLRYLTGKDMNRTQIALWAERSGRFAGAAIIPQSNSEGEAL